MDLMETIHCKNQVVEFIEHTCIFFISIHEKIYELNLINIKMDKNSKIKDSSKDIHIKLAESFQKKNEAGKYKDTLRNDP